MLQEDEEDLLEELIFEPFERSAPEMKKFFKGYVKRIDGDFKKSFNCDIDSLIDITTSGPDSCWLAIK